MYLIKSATATINYNNNNNNGFSKQKEVNEPPKIMNKSFRTSDILSIEKKKKSEFIQHK